MRRLLAALVAIAAAGCGSGTAAEDTSDRFRGQERLVANTVENLQAAAEDGDDAKICRDLLTRDLAQRLARGAGCPATVAAALDDTDSNELDVRSVRITGDHAIARVRLETGDRDRVATVRLAREGRGWRIDAL